MLLQQVGKVKITGLSLKDLNILSSVKPQAPWVHPCGLQLFGGLYLPMMVKLLNMKSLTILLSNQWKITLFQLHLGCLCFGSNATNFVTLLLRLSFDQNFKKNREKI